jgi:hypothetical protein
MMMNEIAIKKYTMEDAYKVVEAIKTELPLELTVFKDGDFAVVDVVEINESGWVTYLPVFEKGIKKSTPSKHIKMRVRELVSELVDNNTYLVDYVLKKKQ